MYALQKLLMSGFEPGSFGVWSDHWSTLPQLLLWIRILFRPWNKILYKYWCGSVVTGSARVIKVSDSNLLLQYFYYSWYVIVYLLQKSFVKFCKLKSRWRRRRWHSKNTLILSISIQSKFDFQDGKLRSQTELIALYKFLLTSSSYLVL